MSRREYRVSFKCAEPGCRETQFYAVSTRRDEAELYASQKRNPYRCTRHANPEENLRPGNEQTRYVVIATRVRSHLPYGDDPEGPWLSGLYWAPEGGRPGSGFTFGPGFNAHASDFPEGTRLIVTAQIELPEPIDMGYLSLPAELQQAVESGYWRSP
jgi:hypothetical protein